MPSLPSANVSEQQEVLLEPAKWLMDYLRDEGLSPPSEAEWFQYGQLATALELETQKRIVQSAVGNSLLVMAREEIASVLTTFIQGLGLASSVEEWYDRLLDYRERRKLRFEAHQAASQ
jgi:hypothetical protein